MRSLWAVLAGWILIGILAFGSQQIMHSMSPWAFDAKGGTSNVPMLLLGLILSCVFGIVGCYVAARLAPSNPMGHAMALGVIGLLVSGLGSYMLWGHNPDWFNLVNPILIIPLAWIGGRLRVNELESGSMLSS
jgi:hypothetical protein